ncbi:MAG TPA: hypothetical protein VN328_00920 [Thermodesulfovibrionales bacterium]|nr:hypothetical protein [Thermodesulfovibrionales bacterium]
MRKKTFMPFLVVGVICFSVLCVYFTESHARTQRTLAVRTQLRAAGLPSSQMFWFAPGPYWVDDFDGGVQSGNLDQTVNIKVWNSGKTLEFGRGPIRFERSGGVKEGILGRDSQLCVVNTASNNKNFLAFMGGKTVEFGYDGCVMKGTLAQDAQLKTWDGKSNQYPKGTVVDFNGAGLVTRATMPAGATTTIDGVYTGTCAIVGIDTFPFKFTARKGVFQGSIDNKLYSLQWKGNYDANGKISNGVLTGWVDDWDTKTKKKLRWTVRGPVNGTINPAGARGTASATTSDGRITRSGNWNAVRTGT